MHFRSYLHTTASRVVVFWRTEESRDYDMVCNRTTPIRLHSSFCSFSFAPVVKDCPLPCFFLVALAGRISSFDVRFPGNTSAMNWSRKTDIMRGHVLSAVRSDSASADLSFPVVWSDLWLLSDAVVSCENRRRAQYVTVSTGDCTS